MKRSRSRATRRVGGRVMPRVRAIVIGSGFGGIGAAVKLKEAGVTDLTILERADTVGGTWRDNTYPGAACDIPAHLYSFSFAPKADWSTHYPRQPEIRDYLEQVTTEFGLRPHLEFDTTVVEAVFDERRAVWTVKAEDGRSFEAELVVGALGPLSKPQLPDIVGRDDFEGPAFHTARWRHDVDLSGRRVGVIGTGASAIQVVPQLAGEVAHLTVFQRTAPWIVPKVDRTYSKFERWLFEHVPGLRALWRRFIYWQKELRFAGFTQDNPAMKLMQWISKWHMRKAIDDPELRAKLEPGYQMGCKRILISNDYYPALAREDVTVETTDITRIVPNGVELEDGRTVELDAIVWGTGFDVVNMLGAVDFVGRGGRRLSEMWDPYPAAHLGTTVPGFPNLVMILGPNTGLGHNSMIHVMESQYRYLVDLVRHLSEPGVVWVEPTVEALEAFKDEVTERNSGLVWASGCRSWYLDDQGYNFALWPGFTYEYRRRTAKLDLNEHHVERRSPVRTPEAA